MFKVAICDDEQPIREYLKNLTEKSMDASVHAFADGEALLADETAYDIILLDISLNQNWDSGRLNGMDVAKKIREKSDVLIIFITALKEYVFEGYDVGAFHYGNTADPVRGCPDFSASFCLGKKPALRKKYDHKQQPSEYCADVYQYAGNVCGRAFIIQGEQVQDHLLRCDLLFAHGAFEICHSSSVAVVVYKAGRSESIFVFGQADVRRNHIF